MNFRNDVIAPAEARLSETACVRRTFHARAMPYYSAYLQSKRYVQSGEPAEGIATWLNRRQSAFAVKSRMAYANDGSRPRTHPILSSRLTGLDA